MQLVCVTKPETEDHKHSENVNWPNSTQLSKLTRKMASSFAMEFDRGSSGGG